MVSVDCDAGSATLNNGEILEGFDLIVVQMEFEVMFGRARWEWRWSQLQQV